MLWIRDQSHARPPTLALLTIQPYEKCLIEFLFRRHDRIKEQKTKKNNNSSVLWVFFVPYHLFEIPDKKTCRVTSPDQN